MPEQNSTGLAPQILRPVAAPTDIFANPNAGAQLSQLASGLSGLAPSLSRYSDELAAKESVRDRTAGENAANQAIQSGKTYAQAIKDGTIDPHQSPWFRLGAYETFGRVSARSYHDAFDMSLKGTPEGQMVNQSTKLDDFNAYERNFRQSWMKDNMGDQVDPILQNSFTKQTESLIEEQRQKFIGQAGTRLVGQVTDAAHEELFGIVTAAQDNHLSDDQLLAQIDLAQQRQIAAGLGKDVVNRLTASAVAQAAKLYGETGNADMLHILAKIPAGPGGKLLGASYAGDAAVEARNEIAKQTQMKYERDEKQEAIAEKKAVNGIFAEFNDAMAKSPNPSAVDTRDFEARLNKVPNGATHVETMMRMKDSFINHQYMDDQDVVSRLMIGIHTKGPGDTGYTTMQTLNEALGAKQITPNRFHELAADIIERDKTGQESTSKLLNDEGVKLFKARNKMNFHAEFGFETQETDWRLNRAEENGLSEYLTWRRGAGANASAKEINEMASTLADKQYAHHADPQEVRDKNSIRPNPELRAGPVAVDPKKTLVTDHSSLDSAVMDFNSFRAGKLSRMSERTLTILRQNNVPPSGADEFFAHQQAAKATSAVPHN